MKVPDLVFEDEEATPTLEFDGVPDLVFDDDAPGIPDLEFDEPEPVAPEPPPEPVVASAAESPDIITDLPLPEDVPGAEPPTPQREMDLRTFQPGGIPLQDTPDLKTVGKSLAVGTANTVGNLLRQAGLAVRQERIVSPKAAERGIKPGEAVTVGTKIFKPVDWEELTPEEKVAKLERTNLEKLGKAFTESVSRDWQTEVEEKSELTFESPGKAAGGVLNLAAQQIPLLLTQLGFSMVSGPGGGLGSMSLIEGGGFNQAGDQMIERMKEKGAKKDAMVEFQHNIEANSWLYGTLSGATEFAGNAFGPLRGLVGIGKKAAQEGMEQITKNVASKPMKKIFRELAGFLGEGTEEATQGGLMNFFMHKAINETRKKHPDFVPEWKDESIWKNFVTGVVLAPILRGGTVTAQQAVRGAKEQGALPDLEFEDAPATQQTIAEAEELALPSFEEAVTRIKAQSQARRDDVEAGLFFQEEENKVLANRLQKEFEATGQDVSKKNVRIFWEDLTGEKLNNEGARDLIKNVWGKTPETLAQEKQRAKETEVTPEAPGVVTEEGLGEAPVTEEVTTPSDEEGVDLFHVGFQAKKGDEFKPDSRGIVWFSTDKTKYGADKTGAPSSQITIPKKDLLVIEDVSGNPTALGQEVVKSTENASKEEIFKEATKRGFKAVQRGYDVAVIPDVANKSIAEAPAAQETLKLTPEEEAKPRLPDNILDRKLAVRKQFPEVKSKAKIRILENKSVDRLLGHENVVNFQEIGEVRKYLEKNKIPYTVLRGDGRELKAWNKRHGDVHAKTDEEILPIWGEIYAREFKKRGGILARDQGDEFIGLLPNYTPKEADAFLDKLDLVVEKKTQEMGLDEITSAKAEYNDLPTGVGYIDFGATEGVPGKFKEVDILADERMVINKAEKIQARADKYGYIKIEDESGKVIGYEPKTSKRKTGVVSKRKAGGRIGATDKKQRPGRKAKGKGPPPKKSKKPPTVPSKPEVEAGSELTGDAKTLFDEYGPTPTKRRVKPEDTGGKKRMAPEARDAAGKLYDEVRTRKEDGGWVVETLYKGDVKSSVKHKSQGAADESYDFNKKNLPKVGRIEGRQQTKGEREERARARDLAEESIAWGMDGATGQLQVKAKDLPDTFRSGGEQYDVWYTPKKGYIKINASKSPFSKDLFFKESETVYVDTKDTKFKHETIKFQTKAELTAEEKAAQEREEQEFQRDHLLGDQLGFVDLSKDKEGDAKIEPVTKGLNNFEIPSETRTDILRRKLQDRMLPLKRVQEAPGVEVTPDTDAYLGEELFTGKAQHELEAVHERLVIPLQRDILRSKVDYDELEAYGYAKHAPERNKRIGEINRKFANEIAETGQILTDYDMERGSGMSNEEATEIVAEAKKKGLTKKYDRLLKQVAAINQEALRLRVKYGLTSKKDAQTIADTFKNYVPLKGVNEVDKKKEKALRARTGRGFDIRGPESKRALGRRSKASNIIANSILALQETIVRGEKNLVSQQFLQLVKENPNPDLWTIDEIKMTRYYDRNKGEVVERIDPMAKLADNVLGVKVAGKQHFITIKSPSLASAMKNLGSEKAGMVVRIMGSVNRYLAAVSTRYNPPFIITNLARDVQAAFINISSEESFKLAGKVLKDVPSAMKGAYQAQRGKKTSEWAQLYDEMSKEGGRIAFFGLENLDVQQAKMMKDINAMRPGAKHKATRALRSVAKFVEDVNSAVENASRLSSYKNYKEQYLKQGLSESEAKNKAASAAKNVTVNFNRKGEYGQMMNAMFVFSTATVSGTAKLFKILGTSRGKKIMAAATIGSFLWAEMNRLLAGVDDDDENYYDKVENWEKENYLIIMRPEGKGSRYKFMLPYGYNVFAALGVAISQAIHHPEEVMGAAAMVATTMANAFNPLGASSTLPQTLAPTQFRWMVDLGMNKNFFGAPIVKEEKFGPKKAKSEIAFKSTSEVSKNIAEAMNKMSGGTKYQPGWADVSPDVMDYVAEYLGGGAGKTFTRTVDIAAKLGSGKPVPIRNVPFARKLVGEVNEYHDVQKMYENMDKLDAIENDYKDLKEVDRVNAFKFKKQNRKAFRLINREIAAKTKKKLKELRIRKEKVEERGLKKQADIYSQRIETLVDKFNKEYKRVMK